MREIDDAHQAENQREAGCYEEIERAKRDAAQKCIQKDLLTAPTRHQFGRPGGQHKHRNAAAKRMKSRLQSG